MGRTCWWRTHSGMELKMGPNTILPNPTLSYLDGQTVRTGEMLIFYPLIEHFIEIMCSSSTLEDMSRLKLLISRVSCQTKTWNAMIDFCQVEFYQFQPVSGLPEDSCSSKAWLESQHFIKLNRVSGEDLWQLEQRPPRARQLHLRVRHEPGEISQLPPTPWLTPWCPCGWPWSSSWQWPTSRSRVGWATLAVMPPVFHLPLPALSEHRESYRCSTQQPFISSLSVFLWTTFWFQAVGKDGIYPGIGWFEKGGNANNDPIRGGC